MGFDWEAAVAGDASYPDLIPAGDHDVTICRMVSQGKNGPFVSKSGDKQVMVVYQDAKGRELADFLTLSHKAGWVLARLLSRCGADLKALTRDGLEPDRFTDEALQQQHLIGKTLRIRVKEGKEGRMKIEPLKGGQANVEEEEIPF